MLNNQFKDLKFLKIGLEEIENSKKTQNDVKNQLQKLEIEKS